MLESGTSWRRFLLRSLDELKAKVSQKGFCTHGERLLEPRSAPDCCIPELVSEACRIGCFCKVQTCISERHKRLQIPVSCPLLPGCIRRRKPSPNSVIVLQKSDQIFPPFNHRKLGYAILPTYIVSPSMQQFNCPAYCLHLKCLNLQKARYF